MIRKLHFPYRILFSEFVLGSAGCTIYSTSTLNYCQILSNEQNVYLHILIYAFNDKLWCFYDGIEKIQKSNLPCLPNFCHHFPKSNSLCKVIAGISLNAIVEQMGLIMDREGQNLKLEGIWSIWWRYRLVYSRKFKWYYI